jgi:hypothetical protein
LWGFNDSQVSSPHRLVLPCHIVYKTTDDGLMHNDKTGTNVIKALRNDQRRSLADWPGVIASLTCSGHDPAIVPDMIAAVCRARKCGLTIDSSTCRSISDNRLVPL